VCLAPRVLTCGGELQPLASNSWSRSKDGAGALALDAKGHGTVVGVEKLAVLLACLFELPGDVLPSIGVFLSWGFKH